MNWMEGLKQTGVPAALGAALLFGAGTPLAKLLLHGVSPWLLAGLLYLGSGLGLTLYRWLTGAPTVSLPRNEAPWFAGAILSGGVIGPVLLMAGLTWSIDNNLTRKVSLSDATWIASVKGLVAGSVNLGLALSAGATMPPLANVAGAMVVGFFAYGVSLALFVVSLRHLGTARTGAYFSIAPFLGTLLALAMGEPATWPLLIAGALMALGIWLHLTERHAHEHTHEVMEHEHEHVHDEHHLHGHGYIVAPGTKHSHRHRHRQLTHTHAHFPDAHHRHEH